MLLMSRRSGTKSASLEHSGSILPCILFSGQLSFLARGGVGAVALMTSCGSGKGTACSGAVPRQRRGGFARGGYGEERSFGFGFETEMKHKRAGCGPRRASICEDTALTVNGREP